MPDQNYRPRRDRKAQTPPEQVAVEAVLKGIWQILSWLFRLVTGSGGKAGKSVAGRFSLNHEKLQQLQEGWEQVEFHAAQEQGRAVAISEADKILDTTFRYMGLPGETMGERLKSAQTKLPAELYTQVWQAHKLRNMLAHEVGARVSPEEAKSAVEAFRRALYHLGVL